MKKCNTCKKPLNEDEYIAGKQSIFRSSSCKKCNNLNSEKRHKIRIEARENIINEARRACANAR